jgi:uncharacterized membrane protein (UPF0127 family)
LLFAAIARCVERVDIKPWRLGPFVRKCRMAIELPAGTAARTGTVEGDVIVLEDA